ncbi:XRE family transcriptional regulator, partial [Nocardia sp. NPDC058497]|uniref:XRE family transcriptional regulator n=1 Tax=Nocardia sp. NPDC058497 TaxID=3346529 RepID=UPI00364B1C50
ILGIPEELLWSDPSAGMATELGTKSGVAPVRLPSGKTVPAMSAPMEAPLAKTLLATLNHYATLDMLAGPHDLLDIVENQLSAIDSAVKGHARDREKLLYASGRFAEFLGWIHQDAGNLRAAMKWSDVALARADECGDTSLHAYVLMRKSNIAGDAGNTGVAVDRVEEALANATGLTTRQRSVLLRQKGHAYAQRTSITGDRGDRRTCVDALAEAADLATEDSIDANDLAQYCSAGYVAMEAAHCWVQLGRPEKALTTLETGLADWAPGSDRDLGMGFARLATAYAGLSQPDEALDVARHALKIHSDTGSHRTIQQLRRVGIALEERGHRGHTQDFADMLRAHIATARVAPATPDEEFEWS